MEGFAIGNVIPDSGIPDENWETFDPPPEISHIQVGNSATRQCADLAFYRRHFVPGYPWGPASKRFSFLLGYFFHLITERFFEAFQYVQQSSDTSGLYSICDG